MRILPALALVTALAGVATPAAAGDDGMMSGSARASAGEVPVDVGVIEHLGAALPLDVTLMDESGEPVTLRDLFDKPVLLLFVYFRCPSICRPMMQELARAIDRMDGMTPGTDFRIITISFDPDETPEVARTTRDEMLGNMRSPPPFDGWRFLTGDESTVRNLTEAAGFKYRYDQKTQSFLHASSLIFLTREGRIVRYIGGLEYLPAQIKLAIIDATIGRQRSFMQAVERLCYAYDPEERSYVLHVNRIILGVTLALVAGLVLFLTIRRRSPGKEA